MIPLLLTLCGSAQATVRLTTVAVQADNVLRYTIRATTTESAQVAVQIWQAGSAPSSGWTTAYTATAARAGTVDIWGLKAATRYNYRVLVDPVVGASYTDSRVRTFTTGALPGNLPTTTATTYAGAPDFNYLIFETRTTDTNDGVILIVDTSGNVVWYQYADAGDDFLVAAYDETEEAVYAIVGVDGVARYAMNGTRTLSWDTMGTLADPPHHEIFVHDGVLYTLVSRAFTVGRAGYVEDGIEGYDSAGNLVYEWWAQADGGLSVTANAAYVWDRVAGPWQALYPTQNDWTHANALSVRDEGGDLKAYVSFRNLSQVAKVDMASGGIEWLMGHNTSGSSRANGDFSMDASGVSSQWWSIQHHTHYEDDGTFLVFDNEISGASRQLELSIDEGAMDVRIDRAVDFSEFVDGGFNGNCDREGGVFRTANGHLVATCGPEFLITDYNSSDVLQWSLDVGTPTAVYRATPLASIGN